MSAEYAGQLAQAELGRRLARHLEYANGDAAQSQPPAATSPALAGSGPRIPDEPDMEVIRGDKSYNKVAFYGMTSGGQFA